MMLKLPTVVFVNGPPGSGKSTLTKALCRSPDVWNDSFAEPIREMLSAVFFPGELNSEKFKSQDIKSTPIRQLACLETLPSPTVREIMIEFSESYMKRLLGQRIFGELLVRRFEEQRHWYSTVVIDDSGFVPEAEVLIESYGADACTLIQLHRPGCTFASDSRSYITLPIRTIVLHNDGTPADMLAQLELEFGAL